MHIRPFQASYPLFERIVSPDAFCSNAKHSFLEYLSQDLLEHSTRSAVYIYQIECHHRRHTGLVALNDIQDFFRENIKQHEKTLRAREESQMDLILRWRAILKPVLLAHPPVPALHDWLENYTNSHSPLLETYFRKDGQTQRIWVVAEAPDIQYLQELFLQEVTDVYIADGHHRTSTVALLHRQHRQEWPQLDFDHLFCAYFATDQLDILDYNRVIEGLNGLSPEQFFGRLSQVFNIELVEHPRKPRRKFQLKLYFRGHWYRLEWKPEVLANFQPTAHSLPVLLDVSLLNELVLHNILGIRDVRTNLRISYVEGTKGLAGIRNSVGDNPNRVGFVLHPVTFADMMEIADAKKILPPKSTYFEPRMKSGILIHMLDK